jgi:hypothetical protein
MQPVLFSLVPSLTQNPAGGQPKYCHSATAIAAVTLVALWRLCYNPARNTHLKDTVMKYTIWPSKNQPETYKTIESSLEEMAELLTKETSPDKDRSRMIKLAEFDAKRGKDGMVNIHGIEVDYDAGQRSAEWARDCLTEAGITGIIDTSYNNAPEFPKWHAFVPLSEPMNVNKRNHMVDRLNGVLGGILAGESWGVAQCFFFGGNREKPENHRTYLVKGNPIDKVEHITPTPYINKKKETETIEKEGKLPDSFFIRNIEHGEDVHDSSMRLIARMVNRGESREFIEWVVYTSIKEAVVRQRGKKEWLERVESKEFERMIDGAFKKRYDETVRWDSDIVYDINDPDSLVAKRSALSVFVWESVFAKNNLYALTAQWGAGKTAFAVSLAIRAAAGLPFQDRRTVPSKVLYLSGENPADVRTRALATQNILGLDPKIVSNNFRATAFPFAIDNDEELAKFIEVAKGQMDYADFIIFDTGPAHSSADDENGNAEAKLLARSMRIMMDGLKDEDGYAPAGLALMHPTKAASKSGEYETMTPRGGSGFSGEVDGLLCMVKDGPGGSKMMPHETKFRGVKFDEMFFENRVIITDGVDNFDNAATTVVTVERTPEEAEAARAKQPPSDAAQRILAALSQYEVPEGVPASMAEVGWAVKMTDFLDAQAEKLYPDAPRPKNALNTTLKRMTGKGLVTKYGDWLHEPLDM